MLSSGYVGLIRSNKVTHPVKLVGDGSQFNLIVFQFCFYSEGVTPISCPPNSSNVAYITALDKNNIAVTWTAAGVGSLTNVTFVLASIRDNNVSWVELDPGKVVMVRPKTVEIGREQACAKYNEKSPNLEPSPYMLEVEKKHVVTGEGLHFKLTRKTKISVAPDITGFVVQGIDGTKTTVGTFAKR